MYKNHQNVPEEKKKNRILYSFSLEITRNLEKNENHENWRNWKQAKISRKNQVKTSKKNLKKKLRDNTSNEHKKWTIFLWFSRENCFIWTWLEKRGGRLKWKISYCIVFLSLKSRVAKQSLCLGTIIKTNLQGFLGFKSYLLFVVSLLRCKIVSNFKYIFSFYLAMCRLEPL